MKDIVDKVIGFHGGRWTDEDQAREIVDIVAQHFTDEINALKVHRDELEAALREVIRITDRKHDIWDRARAALSALRTKDGA